MSSNPALNRELVLLILQFLDEEKFKETIHSLEKESGFFFNTRHFEELVVEGEWDVAEKYLSGFTKLEDNKHSMKIYFEIRKQKYLEALDRKDLAKAADILVKDLKVFSALNDALFKDMTFLLTLEDFRENEQLSKYGDIKSARNIMVKELMKLIEVNPMLCDKLQFPTMKATRLRTLINQSLKWQHQLCKNPKAFPDITTLFTDHTCGPPQGALNGARAPSPVASPLLNASPVLMAGAFPPFGAPIPFQVAPAALPNPMAGWPNISPVPHPTTSIGSMGLGASNNIVLAKRPRSPPTNTLDNQTADSEHVLKRPRPLGPSDEVNHVPLAYITQTQGHNSYSSDDLPKNVVMNLSQGAYVKSLDFHPLKQNLLLVGTNNGELMVWDLVSRERIAVRNFEVWKLSSIEPSLSHGLSASINRVTWNSDGTFIGVAYSKRLVHLYRFNDPGVLIDHLEIEAHIGSVNDVAFSYPDNHMSIITCGEDRLVKVWNPITGDKLKTFEGHEYPVHSVYPHYKEDIHKVKIHVIFSTGTDGKIKVWMYGNKGSIIDYDAPGRSSIMMAHSEDRSRLFSCGSNKEGESFLVEWNEAVGTIKRTYLGLGKWSVGIVRFDTAKNKFLAAGDEFKVKFWDVDSVNLFAATDADGGLPACPCIRFNKAGSLMAVSTSDNGIKVLANTDGLKLLRMADNRSIDASRVASLLASVKGPTIMSMLPAGNTSTGAAFLDFSSVEPAMVAVNTDSQSMIDLNPKLPNVSVEKSKICKVSEISEQSQCRSLRLPDNIIPATRVSRLVYTNSGFGILGLASNAIHKLWKWPKNDRNLSGKATASIPPQLWQPLSGILMTNDLSGRNPEDATSCFALSKNDSYVMSVSGGQVSLFNMRNFETLAAFMPPPPAATFLAFHPQDNNIVAIGMEDSSIQIHDIRLEQAMTILKGHQKRITGLAFSSLHNVLVSSGSDSQLCVWSMDAWVKLASKPMQVPSGRTVNPLSDTRVQFHHDQTHLLTVHETQIAIYEAPKLDCLKQWFAPEARGPITYATYSCDSQSIFVSFQDGSISIVVASNLRLKCRINPDAYLPPNPSARVFPLCIAAHPSEPHQFALGLSDGGVCVLEPLESEGQWGTLPAENGVGTSNDSGVAGKDQPQR